MVHIIHFTIRDLFKFHNLGLDPNMENAVTVFPQVEIFKYLIKRWFWNFIYPVTNFDETLQI